MKNKSNEIILFYLALSLIMTTLCHNYFVDNFSKNTFLTISFAKDLFFIISIGLLLKYIIYQNDKSNKKTYDQIKKSHDEINETNEKYNIVAKATSDTIWDWKIQEDTFSWNKGINDIFGYQVEEVGNSSKWWFNNIHPEDSIKMSIRLYSFIEQKTAKWQDEYRFKCADGSYKYVLDRGFLIKDKNNKAVRMIGSMQDITNQKEEEQRLKLLETVITHSKDSVAIIKPDDKDINNTKIIYINPAFTALTGLTSTEMSKKLIDIDIESKYDPYPMKRLLQSIKNKEEYFIESINYKDNEEEHWIEFSMIPIFNVEKKLSHWVSIQRDITKEKKSQREKEQLIRELTQNNKDLKQFSYIISHNLRAPLSNLTGLLYLLNDIKIDDTELKEILAGFKKSTQHLNDTISDLVKVIVIKDNPTIQREKINLTHVIETITLQLKTQIEQNKPAIICNFNSNFDFISNKTYIESILLNLLSNSLKYKKENSKPLITISAETKGQICEIKFKDNGIGIDLDRNSNKIFGLYQRFHDYPDSKGLGLYLVKSQIEAIGGTITVESEVNHGTEFTITLN